MQGFRITAAAMTVGAVFVPALATAQMAAQVAAPTVADRFRLQSSAVAGAALTPDLRLRMLTTPTTRPDALDGRVQRGFGGSMIDYYPFGEAGFHLSAGGRMAPRLAARKDEAARLLYAPRQGGLRASRRMTPAVTMGYTAVVDSAMTLGVEGGMMAGRVDPVAQQVRMPNTARERGANSVVRMAFGYKF